MTDRDPEGGLEVQAALRRLIARQDLRADEVESLFGRLMDGELSDAQKAGLLVALASKGETPEEITGAARAMRARAVEIPHSLAGVVDTCGTGGDGSGSFNVSTAAALVAAAAGVPVAKHGNRSISSRSGSADVLSSLGVDLELEPQASARCLEQVGIAFLFAPRHHPAMREVMPVRRDLAVRTIFNLLGPLTNPARAQRQVMGVYGADLVAPLGRVLLELGAEHALVVHGDGLDEITTTGVTHVAEVRGPELSRSPDSEGEVLLYDVEASDFGIARATLEQIAGDDPDHNAELLQRVLEGESGPLADITALNAAAAIYVGGLTDSLAQGVERARSVLAEGSGWRKLVELREFSA